MTKCPHCGGVVEQEKPTPRQFEAFRLVHVVGITQTEAADVMGVTRPAITQLLSRLRGKMPYIFPAKVTHRKIIRYDDTMVYGISRIF